MILAGMDHVLKHPGHDPAASYTDPARPLAAGLVDGIVRFLDDAR